MTMCSQNSSYVHTFLPLIKVALNPEVVQSLGLVCVQCVQRHHVYMHLCTLASGGGVQS